jgi:AbrB family looped-hinge helix DNA binding protein
MIATITTKGQIVIPIEIRRKLGLVCGSQVKVEEKDGVILLKPTGKAVFSKLKGSINEDLLSDLKEYKAQNVEK